MTNYLYQTPATGKGGRAIAASVLGHVAFFGLLLFLTSWLQPPLLELGGGPGGGSGGNIVTVGLSDQLSGGAGMYKPSLTPQPEAAPPPEKPKAVEPEPETETKPVFEVQESSTKPAKPPESKPPSPPRRVKTELAQPTPGVIPQEARPGSGGSPGGGAGSGGGIGSGVGVQLGGGTGGPGLDSWYLRQVERRISENWLRSTLGNLSNPVEAAVAFEITAAGQIESVQVIESSGIGSVDLSAERAVRASNPLPPLPPEFRRQRVRFVARFEYPPR